MNMISLVMPKTRLGPTAQNLTLELTLGPA